MKGRPRERSGLWQRLLSSYGDSSTASSRAMSAGPFPLEWVVNRPSRSTTTSRSSSWSIRSTISSSEVGRLIELDARGRLDTSRRANRPSARPT